VIEGGLVAVAVMLALLSAAGPISRFLSARADTGLVDIGPVVSLLAIVVLLAFGVGVAYSFVAVPAQTQLQEELPEEVRGRVFGVLNMLVSIASFVPIIVVGPIADLVGTPVVIFLSALLVGVAGVASILKANATIPGTATPGTHGAPVDPVAVATVPLPHAEAGHPLFDFSFSHAPAAVVPDGGVGGGVARETPVERNLGFRQAADWVRMRVKGRKADAPAAGPTDGVAEAAASESGTRSTGAPTAAAEPTDGSGERSERRDATGRAGASAAVAPPERTMDAPVEQPPVIATDDAEPRTEGTLERPADSSGARPDAAAPADPSPADASPAASRPAARWQPAVPVAPIVGEGTTPDEAPVEPPFVAPPDAATTSWRIPAVLRPTAPPDAALPPVTADGPAARAPEQPRPSDEDEPPRRRRRPFAAREARSAPPRAQTPAPPDPVDPTETELPVFRPDPRDVEDEGSRGGMG
jgi:hypothetical protein